MFPDCVAFVADCVLRRNDDLLMLSFVDETRLLSFGDDEGIEEVDAPDGLRTDVPTLAAGNAGQFIFQVTREGVSISKPGSGVMTSWTPADGKKVTVGAVGGERVVVGIEGGELVALEVTADKLKLLGFVACTL
jgi:Mono-functional DNA-alkylating methyl methanesulfonate N-term